MATQIFNTQSTTNGYALEDIANVVCNDMAFNSVRVLMRKNTKRDALYSMSDGMSSVLAQSQPNQKTGGGRDRHSLYEVRDKLCLLGLDHDDAHYLTSMSALLFVLNSKERFENTQSLMLKTQMSTLYDLAVAIQDAGQKDLTDTHNDKNLQTLTNKFVNTLDFNCEFGIDCNYPDGATTRTQAGKALRTVYLRFLKDVNNTMPEVFAFNNRCDVYRDSNVKNKPASPDKVYVRRPIVRQHHEDSQGYASAPSPYR